MATSKPRAGGRSKGPPFERAAAILHAMGVPENLRLLVLLLSGPRSVEELAVATHKAVYLVARRLSRLSRLGLVAPRPAAHYALGGERVRRLVRLGLARARP